MNEYSCQSEVYAIANGTEVLDFDTSLPAAPILITVSGRYLQIGGLAKEILLCLRDNPCGICNIQDHLMRAQGGGWPEDQLQNALNTLVDRNLIRLESEKDVRDSVAASPSIDPGNYLLFKITLLSERMLKPITSGLAFLFNTRLVSIMFPVMALLQAILSFTVLSNLQGTVASLRGTDYLILLAGNYIGLLLHELGHASACRAGGAKHGVIGFGFYWCFPAFAASLAFILYIATGNHVFLALAGIYDMVVWISMWPFVRLDGYWLMSDFLGVPNLMDANVDICVWLVRKLVGRPAESPTVCRLRPVWMRGVYLVYYVLFCCMAVWMIYMLFAIYVPHVFRTFPDLIREFTRELRMAGITLRSLGKFFHLLIVLASLVALSGVLYRTSRTVLRALAQGIRST